MPLSYWVLTIDADGGPWVSLHNLKSQAELALFQYIADEWDEGIMERKMPKTLKKAVELFFENDPGHVWFIDQVVVNEKTRRVNKGWR